MKYIQIKDKQLVIATQQQPMPKADEVLIKVAAAGINRPDVFQRKGYYPPPPGASDIPGLEVAGEIIQMGENVTQWQLGDKVCALLTGGGYAEYAVAHQGLCLPVPAGVSVEDAASLPETFFTVCYNLFLKAQMKSGQRLLIHGGGSGIGTAAIPIATAMGIEVFTTAGTDEKCQRCKQLGAAFAINYNTDDFVDVVKQHTDGRGVDVILDMVGGDYVQRNFRAVSFGGRIIQIAFLQGVKVTLDLTALMLKQITLTGATLRSRPTEEKAAITRFIKENVWPLVENGQIKPVIDRFYPLDQAAAAHQLMESNKHFGKIMLRP